MNTVPCKCDKCGAQFRDAFNLKRHENRKQNCAPIIDPPGQIVDIKKPLCRYCGRVFTTVTSMYRHIRRSCKIAGSDEGMNKLFEHTLQRQLAEQSAQIAEIAEIAKMLQSQLIPSAAAGAPSAAAGAGSPKPTRSARSMHSMHSMHQNNTQNVAGNVTTNNTTINTTMNTTNTTTIINIHPWDSDRRIAVDVGHVTAAFAENSRLREYTALGDHAMVDPEIAPPYVTELLMDLTKRAHATPESRNIYMNPRRADQVLVHMRSGRWEVLSLLDATREIFDGVAKDIRMIIITREICASLPTEAQNALGLAGLMYEYEPGEYAKLARASMSAHLSNTHPQIASSD